MHRIIIESLAILTFCILKSVLQEKPDTEKEPKPNEETCIEE